VSDLIISGTVGLIKASDSAMIIMRKARPNKLSNNRKPEYHLIRKVRTINFRSENCEILSLHGCQMSLRVAVLEEIKNCSVNRMSQFS
jgi:hypothetical protein